MTRGCARSASSPSCTATDSLSDCARSRDGIDGFIDTFGTGYVDRTCNIGVAPGKIDTIIDFEAAGKFGAKTDGGAAPSGTGDLGELANLVARGAIVMPVVAVYQLERVHERIGRLRNAGATARSPSISRWPPMRDRSASKRLVSSRTPTMVGRSKVLKT